jgi:hypothetical protein
MGAAIQDRGARFHFDVLILFYFGGPVSSARSR